MIALDVCLNLEVNGRRILRDCSVQVGEGEVYGIIGRSGSGKSTLALAILGLLGRNVKRSGHVLLYGRDLLRCTEGQMRAIRGKDLTLVLQAASSALNPWLTVEAHFREAWLAHSKEAWITQREKVLQLLASVGLEGTPEFLSRRPGQISIGQAQRLLIAMALLHRPKLLILDEPTSALDCMARAEVQRLIRQINGDTGVAVLYISHDLNAVRQVCDRVGVLDQGTVVESAPPDRLFEHPAHCATQALAAAYLQETAGPSASSLILSR